jgi:hypothetical protein
LAKLAADGGEQGGEFAVLPPEVRPFLRDEYGLPFSALYAVNMTSFSAKAGNKPEPFNRSKDGARLAGKAFFRDNATSTCGDHPHNYRFLYQQQCLALLSY